MKSKKIYLYLGLPKTSAISICDTVYNPLNKSILNNNNINFKETWFKDNGQQLIPVLTNDIYNTWNNKNTEINKEKIYQQNEQVYNELIQELKLDRSFLITCGNLLLENKEVLINLKETICKNSFFNIEFKVIIYTRNPYELSSKLFQEMAINKGLSEYKEFLESIKTLYANISTVSRIFGKENIILTPYEKAVKTNFGVVGHFLNILGVEKEDLCKINFNEEIEDFTKLSTELALYINKNEPKIINGKNNENREDNDFDALLFTVKGNYYKLDNKKLDQIYKAIYSDLEYLNNEFEVDYTQLNGVLENQNNDFVYDEKSVKLAFNFSTNTVRKYMIEFLKNDNILLANVLEKMQNKPNNSKVKEIILHAGMHKTASTSIQETLLHESNKNILNKNNISAHFDKYSNNNSIFVTSFYNKPQDGYYFKRNGISSKDAENILDIVNSEILDELENDKQLLISSENISGMDIRRLTRMKNYLIDNCKYNVKFKIILYVRNPITYFSAFVQTTNISNTENNFVNYRNQFKFLYSIFENLTKVFGKENINIYQFEDTCKHEYGPTGYFLDILKFSNEDIHNINYINSNIGMSMEAFNIMKFINEKEPLFISGSVNKNRYKGENIAISQIKGDKFKLTPNEILIAYEDIYEHLVYLKENLILIIRT